MTLPEPDIAYFEKFGMSVIISKHVWMEDLIFLIIKFYVMILTDF